MARFDVIVVGAGPAGSTAARELAAAGAAFRGGSTVRGLEMSGSAVVRGEGFEAEAEFLVCADGAHSPVGRMAGQGEDIAECAAWEVEVRTGRQRGEYQARALIELGYEPWGYAWLFPKASVFSVGIVLPREQAPTMKRRVERYVQRLGLRGAEVDVARGHKIRFRRGGERLTNGRALLAGDAAGLADEFTDEGIAYAVQSGKLGAKNVLRAIGGDGDLGRCEAAIDREVMPELEAARLIGFMFYGMLRRAPRGWMLASGRLPYLWDALFAVQRGESTYAREAARVPVLPGMARRMLARR